MASLALKQHRVNQAIGINRVTYQVALLLYLFRKSQQSIANKVLQSSYHQGFINEAQKVKDELIKSIEQSESIEEKRSLLKRLLELEESTEKEVNQLEKIAHG